LSSNGLGNRGDGDALVFLARHGSAQVEIFEIEGRKASYMNGNDAVEENFDGAEVS
jgi:hypothetical protein